MKLNFVLNTLVLASSLVAGCQYLDRNENVTNNIMGKKIIFPNKGIAYKNFGNNHTDSAQITNCHNKIVYYFDANCGYCLNKLEGWNKLLEKVKPTDISFVFYARSDDDFELFSYAMENNPLLNYPVFLDSMDLFRAINMLDASHPNVFLLKNDTIIAYGDPKKVLDNYLTKTN